MTTKAIELTLALLLKILTRRRLAPLTTFIQVYDLSNVKILDLDVIIKNHQNYSPLTPHTIYSEKTAYDWADQKIEAAFHDVLKEEEGRNIHALDGTGANWERTVRRMSEAKVRNVDGRFSSIFIATSYF